MVFQANLDNRTLLSNISPLMFRIMCQDDLNMELRSNCGHVYVLVEKVENDNIFRYLIFLE